jgi:hypothetical protein
MIPKQSKTIEELSNKTGKSVDEIRRLWNSAEVEARNLILMNPKKYAKHIMYSDPWFALVYKVISDNLGLSADMDLDA